MPKVTLPPLPANGQGLLKTKSFSDISDPYTNSVYSSLELDDLDSGLMSSLNGRLGVANLSEDFQLRDYHIQPEQASLARSDSMLSSSTIYGSGVQSNGQDKNYFTLPGCSVRWYQPYATSMSLMQWSFFFSYNVWRGIYRDLTGRIHDRGVHTHIRFRCMLDDSEVPSSERILGQNMFHPVSPGARDKLDQTGPGIDSHQILIKRENLRTDSADLLKVLRPYNEHIAVNLYRKSGLMTHHNFNQDAPVPTGAKFSSFGSRGGNPQYVASESHTATHMDLHHMAALSKGYHEISIQAAIEEPEGSGVFLQNVGSPLKSPNQGRGYFNLVGKLSLGIRNARVLNLL